MTSRFYDAIWDGPATAELRRIVAAEGKGCTRLIDLGCGTGLVCGIARQLGAEVVGVDSSPGMRHRALCRGRVDRAIGPEQLESEIPDAWADIVVMTNVLHVAKSPSEMLGLAVHKGTPGGTLIISWPRDGLTPLAMLSSDLRHGRRLGPSLFAHGLRLLVGVLGLFTMAGRQRRNIRAQDLRELVEDWQGYSRLRRLTAAGVQEVAILTTRST